MFRYYNNYCFYYSRFKSNLQPSKITKKRLNFLRRSMVQETGLELREMDKKRKILSHTVHYYNHKSMLIYFPLNIRTISNKCILQKLIQLLSS